MTELGRLCFGEGLHFFLPSAEATVFFVCLFELFKIRWVENKFASKVHTKQTHSYKFPREPSLLFKFFIIITVINYILHLELW